MSETSDRRRRTDLDLFVLALIESGISTPYQLQKAAGLSQGATIPTLQRLLEAGFVIQGKIGLRGRTDYKVVALGRAALKRGWRKREVGEPRYLKRWILSRWRRTPILEMEPILIEDWLAELGGGVHQLANGTRLKIRNIMSVVFRHGIRHGFLPRDGHANPMKYVRQSGRSTKEQTYLT